MLETELAEYDDVKEGKGDAPAIPFPLSPFSKLEVGMLAERSCFTKSNRNIELVWCYIPTVLVRTIDIHVQTMEYQLCNCSDFALVCALNLALYKIKMNG